MGYETRADGIITIDPPIPWDDIKYSPYLRSVANSPDGGWRDVEYIADEAAALASLGPTAVAATGIKPTNEGQPWTRYALVEQLTELVNQHPDRTYGGYIECSGPEGGPPWRIVVRDGQAVEVHPTLTWPNETPVEALDLDSIRADLAYATEGIDGPDQTYNPHALHALRAAEKLLAEVERLRADDGAWLVWSNQHGQWWRPARRGYTTIIDEAGRYTRAEAEAIVRDATLDGQLVHTKLNDVTGEVYRSFDEVMVRAPETATDTSR